MGACQICHGTGRQHHGRCPKFLSSGVEAVLETGLTSGQRYGFAEAIKGGTNYVYIAATDQAPRRWDGAAAATTVVVGPPENPRYLLWHKGSAGPCSCPSTVPCFSCRYDRRATVQAILSLLAILSLFALVAWCLCGCVSHPSYVGLRTGAYVQLPVLGRVGGIEFNLEESSDAESLRAVHSDPDHGGLRGPDEGSGAASSRGRFRDRADRTLEAA